jgi:hypothetical protein
MTTILYKEWLPDLPALGNPGELEAKNVLSVDDNYRNYEPIGGYASGTLPSFPLGAFKSDGTAGAFIYAGTQARIYQFQGSGWTACSTAVSTTDYWQFAMYEDLVFAAGSGTTMLASTNKALADFQPVSNAPIARAVGRIGQFIMAGNFVGTEPHSVRWSSIDQPTTWPTPGSSTAIASQSGQQALNAENGPVNAIASGDQYGIIFQANAITRVTYIGGTAVFQFDNISKNIGCAYQGSMVQVGGVTYFFDRSGIFMTDGVSVTPVGLGKVDKTIMGLIATDAAANVTGSVDKSKQLIGWSIPRAGHSGICDYILWMSYGTSHKFTHAEQTCNSFVKGNVNVTGTAVVQYPPAANSLPELEAFKDSTPIIGSFDGSATANSAVIETGEAQLSEGMFTHVSGVKCLTDQANRTIALGARNGQESSVSYTSEVTATAVTGYSDFRSSARFHRVRTTITGTFNAAQGLEVIFQPEGGR